MNAAAAISRQPEPYADTDWRIVSGPICGSLLGPEWIVAADDKYFRVGVLTVGQLERGVPASDLDLLECDENGEPL